MCNVNHMRVVIDLSYSLLNVSTVLLKAKRQRLSNDFVSEVRVVVCACVCACVLYVEIGFIVGICI